MEPASWRNSTRSEELSGGGEMRGVDPAGEVVSGDDDAALASLGNRHRDYQGNDGGMFTGCH